MVMLSAILSKARSIVSKSSFSGNNIVMSIYPGRNRNNGKPRTITMNESLSIAATESTKNKRMNISIVSCGICGILWNIGIFLNSFLMFKFKYSYGNS